MWTSFFKRYGERYSIASIYLVFGTFSLISAVILFGILHSTGALRIVGSNYEAEFAGAFAGFLVTFFFLVKSYNANVGKLRIMLSGNVLSKSGTPVSGAMV